MSSMGNPQGRAKTYKIRHSFPQANSNLPQKGRLDGRSLDLASNSFGPNGSRDSSVLNRAALPTLPTRQDPLPSRRSRKERKEQIDLDHVREDLPVKGYESEIRKLVRDNDVLILTAETGAGKTTEVGQMLVREGYLVDHLQPRRIATSSSAAYIAATKGEEIGQSIGFQHSHESLVSEDSKLIFATDGYYLAKQSSRAPHGYREPNTGPQRVLILDEFHEKNPNMELILGLWKERRKEGDDTKLVIMSATLDTEPLQDLFPEAKTISIPGRTFPVHDRAPEESAVETLRELVVEGKNVLVFLPGKGEIAALESKLFAEGVDAEVVPLHSQLSRQEQELAFKEYLRPKIVLSTDIAQTSITIPDVHAVVDFGMKRMLEVIDGVPTLTIENISQYDSKQRRGRAGRVMEGEYIWLGRVPVEELNRESKPPIQISPLDSQLLRLAAGGRRIELLDLLNPPTDEKLEHDYALLRRLGLMGQQGHVTDRGRELFSDLRLPTSSRQGTMILEAIRREDLDPKIVERMIDIVAIDQAEGIVLSRATRKNPDKWKRLCTQECNSKVDYRSDHLAQLEAFRNVLADGIERPEKFGIDSVAVKRALETRRVIRKRLGFDPEAPVEPEHLTARQRRLSLECIWRAHIDCAFVRTASENDRDTLYRSPGFDGTRLLSRDSVLENANFVVGTPFDLVIMDDDGSRVLKLLTMANEIDRSWYKKNLPSELKRERPLKDMKEPASDAEKRKKREKRKNKRFPSPRRIGRGRHMG